MPLEIAEERDGGVLVLLPAGRLDSSNAHAFETVVMGHIGSGENRLIVDFRGLDFISSAALRVVILATKALQRSAGKIVLCMMKNHVEEVFRISGFYRIILITATREAALELLVSPTDT